MGIKYGWNKIDNDAYTEKYNYFVCVELNENVGCFNNIYENNSINEMKSFFGSDMCQEVNGTSIECEKGNISCMLKNDNSLECIEDDYTCSMSYRDFSCKTNVQ